jgi:hypothetical protein
MSPELRDCTKMMEFLRKEILIISICDLSQWMHEDYHANGRRNSGHTLRSMISLFFASRSFFNVSTSVDSVFAASSVFVSSFAGAASEYHLDAIRELDGEMN